MGIIINNCEILLDTLIPKESLHIKYNDIPKNFSTKELLEIDNTWEETTSEKLRKGVNIFNGNLFGLKSWSFSKNSLFIELFNTNYKEYVGTRQEGLNINLDASLANPIAICIVLVTKDNYIVMEKRNGVDVYEGSYHVIGGFMDRDRELKFDPKPDPFYAIESEVFEELRLSIYGEVKNLIGLVYDHKTPHPEICFHFNTSKSLEEIQKNVISIESGEVTGVFGVKNDAEKLQEYIISNYKLISTTGFGCLLLYGKYVFGDIWFNKISTDVLTKI